jgi:peptide/nickel transport system permease protein
MLVTAAEQTAGSTPVGPVVGPVDGPEVGTADGHGLSRGRLVLRRFLRRRLAVAGVVVLVALFLLAFVGPHLTRWDYASQDPDPSHWLKGSSPLHWFGTTDIGEDVFAQTMRGLQKSLVIGLVGALLATGVAALVGSFAGYFGGWVERMLLWLTDLLLVLPSFLILAILSPIFRGKTWLLFVVLLAGFSWMIISRVIRGLAISLREREFVQAARFMGVHPVRIVFRHLLPNMASLLIIDYTINVGVVILGESALSYFGFGVQPPDVSLGTLIRDGTAAALTFPWLFLYAGGLLTLIMLSVNFIGDGLRDALDPTALSAKAR